MSEKVWNGFKRLDFSFEGREAILKLHGKNKKFERYKKNCDECDLLVVIENGFVHLSDKLQKHKFDSVFRDVYVLDLSYGCKVTKLKLRKKKNEL